MLIGSYFFLITRDSSVLNITDCLRQEEVCYYKQISVEKKGELKGNTLEFKVWHGYQSQLIARSIQGQDLEIMPAFADRARAIVSTPGKHTTLRDSIMGR